MAGIELPRVEAGVHSLIKRAEGQALVEFALVLPLLLFLALGIFDFGKALNYKNDLNHLAGQAVRYAEVGNNPCGSTKPFDRCILDTADSDQLKDPATGATLNICTQPDAQGENQVIATVAYTYRWLPALGGIARAFPSFLGGKDGDFTTVDIVSSATGRQETLSGYQPPPCSSG
jgi:hypothetical protein